MVYNLQLRCIKDVIEFDNLDPSVREQFRQRDLDFYYTLWLQCGMLTFDTNERIKLYERAYHTL